MSRFGRILDNGQYAQMQTTGFRDTIGYYLGALNKLLGSADILVGAPLILYVGRGDTPLKVLAVLALKEIVIGAALIGIGAGFQACCEKPVPGDRRPTAPALLQLARHLNPLKL